MVLMLIMGILACKMYIFFVFSVWCTLHGSVFNIILLLLLACHSKAVFSDPGEFHET